MVKFLKFRPLAYLEPCKTSMMKLFCEYMAPLVVHYFHKNIPLYMLHRVLNASLKSIWYSDCKVTCMDFKLNKNGK